MKCTVCGSEDAGETGRCDACDAAGSVRSEVGERRPLRMFRPAALLLVIALLVVGLAYYRFFLPDGVAAVVNGEEISVTALDAAVDRFRTSVEGQYGRDVFSGEGGTVELRKLRSRMLADLIRERVVLQEARGTGVAAEPGEIDEAVKSLQASWNLNDEAFTDHVAARYGGMRAFRRQVAEQITIDRFVRTHIAAGVSDPAARQSAVAQWLRQAQGRAAVRVALAEQWSASGCACCAGKGGEPQGAAGPQPTAAIARADERPAQQENDRLRAAEQAGRAYWRETRGAEAVRAEARDFGCHFEIDIIKDGRVVKSLRYQNNRITEM